MTTVSQLKGTIEGMYTLNVPVTVQPERFFQSLLEAFSKGMISERQYYAELAKWQALIDKYSGVKVGRT